jgi:hypothetical protein
MVAISIQLFIYTGDVGLKILHMTLNSIRLVCLATGYLNINGRNILMLPVPM